MDLQAMVDHRACRVGPHAAGAARVVDRAAALTEVFEQRLVAARLSAGQQFRFDHTCQRRAAGNAAQQPRALEYVAHVFRRRQEVGADRRLGERVGRRDRDAATPATQLSVGVSVPFAESDPDIVAFIEKVQLSADQINGSIAKMNERKVGAEVVAREFLKANPQVWKAWVPSDVAAKVSTALK